MDKQGFVEFISTEFNRILSRINYRRKTFDQPMDVNLLHEEDDFSLWLNFVGNKDEKVVQQLCISKPRKDELGNLIIGNHVERALCSWYLVEKKLELNYWEVIALLLTDSINDLFPVLSDGPNKRVFLEKIIRSFGTRNAPIIVRNAQKLIDSIVNELPLCGSPMQTWAMNNSVMFIDPVFDSLTPQEILEYHKKKNNELFPWTSMGLSDSSMVKNYMLKVDLRKYSPFCVKHHSPMRNLYQPLGMTGPDKPLISTSSMKALENSGVSRGGWNWMTAFVDLPLNFEDQIMIHHKHQDKINVSTKKFMCFGTPAVAIGEQVSNGTILSLEPGDRAVIFNSHCEASYVESIEKSFVSVNGVRTEVNIITTVLKRTFKDGVKFTNLHGNKGVAVFCDTGLMFDPIANKNRDIDIIVAAKTVENRKNFGQIFEALATLLNGPNKNMVIPDDYFCDIEKVKNKLEAAGVRRDCTCDMTSPWGKLKAICGWLFWGLLKEPEDSLWEKNDVSRIDQLGIRTSGTKVSHIEFKGLTTLFGPQSGVIKEILSHQEGVDVVKEFKCVLESMKGNNDTTKKPVISWKNIKPLNQSKGFLHEKAELSGTVSDQFHKNGFYLEVPVIYSTHIPGRKSKPVIETTSNSVFEDYKVYKTSLLYVPFSDVREPWQHQCGLWGISDTAALINNIILACHEFSVSQEPDRLELAIKTYFHTVSKKLSTKSGLISQYCLAVRYPSSVKATASQKPALPKNTIEIHEDMARNLRIKHGEFVVVERFPCLGFMSVRVQQVFITNDPNCKYVIRVSKGSLNSTGLDFDGDTLFVSSFHTPEAKADLEYEFRYPNKETEKFINMAYDNKKTKVCESTIDDFCNKSLKNHQPPMTFEELTPSAQSEIVKMLTGIKVGTGTVVALGYNLSRILEGYVGYEDSKLNAEVEFILDKVANSVFGSKHAVTKLLETMSKPA